MSEEIHHLRKNFKIKTKTRENNNSNYHKEEVNTFGPKLIRVPYSIV